MENIIKVFLALTVLLVSVTTAFAQATCTLNGEEVPCEQLEGAIGAIGSMLLIFPLIALLMFIFWFVMLIHAIKNEIDNKVLWIIILLFVGPLGALIYYFVVKRPYTKMMKSGAQPGQLGMPQSGVMPGQPGMPQQGTNFPPQPPLMPR